MLIQEVVKGDLTYRNNHNIILHNTSIIMQY